MGAPSYGAPPPGYASNEERLWALSAHLGGIFFGFLAPLVVLLVKGSESATLRAHSVEALNFQITWNAAAILTSIVAVCTAIFSFGASAVLPFACGVVILVFALLAGVKANEGVVYHYPVSLRLVR